MPNWDQPDDDLPSGTLSYDNLVKDAGIVAVDAFDDIASASDDTMILFYTSGTTGSPKGVLSSGKFISLQIIIQLCKYMSGGFGHMIHYEKLLNREFPVIKHDYTDKDTALYALGIGVGSDPLDPSQLNAVYEGAPKFAAMPAMVNVLGYPGFWAREPDTGIEWQKVLHGEQSLTLHAPIRSQGTVQGTTRITRIIDKGEGKGALIYSEREITDADTGTLLATVSSTLFARSNGGFGGPTGPVNSVHTLPDRVPDSFHDFKTSDRAALIYRLSGDFNPLHADPDIARGVGFDRPILHGMCTLGVASWSIPAALRAGDFTSLTHMQLRFSAPVYPGETIRTETWVDGDDVSFRARVLERDTVVLNNGLARLT